MIETTAQVLDGELTLATATVDTPDGPFIGGACSFTAGNASLRAASETAERVALLFEGPRHVVSTTEAKAAGGSFAEVLGACPAPDGWVPTRGIGSDEPVWLPADLVLLRWMGSRELPIRQSSVGTAAHPDRAKAVDSGLRECVERLAVRSVWSAATTLTNVTEQLNAALPGSLLEAISRHGLEAHAWLVDATRPLAVVVVAVASSQGRVTFGASCGRTLEHGLRHALCEAVSVRAAFAGANSLKRNFSMAGERIDLAIKASAFQESFLAFLRRLERPAEAVGGAQGALDVMEYVEEKHGVAPLIFDLGRRDSVHVVKVVIPSSEFFVPRRHCGYVLAPGYLE